jgi:phosphatidylglycerophosphatase A
MKQTVEKRAASGPLDYIALAVTTFGVGFIPGAPGTYGSLTAVGVYVAAANAFKGLRYGAELASPEHLVATVHAAILVLLLLFCLLGVWSAGRSVELLGNTDAKEAVVDEVIGQLLVFLFIPFTTSWLLIGAAFLLFRLFDIWKPYPINSLQSLPLGLGICADDILAAVYAGVCLSILQAVSLWV